MTRVRLANGTTLVGTAAEKHLRSQEERKMKTQEKANAQPEESMSVSTLAQRALDRMAEGIAKQANVTFAEATSRALRTEEGQRLYAQIVGPDRDKTKADFDAELSEARKRLELARKGALPLSAEDQIEKRARQLYETGQEKTIEQARTRALNERPELYTQYLSETA